MLIYVKIIEKNLKYIFQNLRWCYANFMLIYVHKIIYGQTDGRTTQNYSSEPHKIKHKIEKKKKRKERSGGWY